MRLQLFTPCFQNGYFKKLCYDHKSFYLVPRSLQSDGLNLWYFKLVTIWPNTLIVLTYERSTTSGCNNIGNQYLVFVVHLLIIYFSQIKRKQEEQKLELFFLIYHCNTKNTFVSKRYLKLFILFIQLSGRIQHSSSPAHQISCTDPPFCRTALDISVHYTCSKGRPVQKLCCTLLTLNCDIHVPQLVFWIERRPL